MRLIKKTACECGGYQYFWSWEIEGWRGPKNVRLTCLRCGNPTLYERLLYWWYGYIRNPVDIVEETRKANTRKTDE